MNEKLDLVEILKDCPKGKVLYSPMLGEVLFYSIDQQDDVCPIDVTDIENRIVYSFCKDGRYMSDALDGECLLFPSKEERNWSKFKVKKPKFDPKTLNTFDRVLVRGTEKGQWCCTLYSHRKEIDESTYRYVTSRYTYAYCIPYNEDTKHLVGTTDEAPEYYRYWED